MTIDQFSQIKDFINSAQSILVLISPASDLDVLAASSALFLSLEESGKDVVYASPELPSESNQHLVGTDRIKTEISNKNLIVSFDYQEAAVEKVSYHIGEETNRFYLTIQPQKSHQPLDKDTVEVGYVGAEADLVFLVGVSSYESLEHLYLGNESVFADTTVISINNYDSDVGDVKVNTTDHVNLSCAMAEIIRKTELSLNGDIATNLLLSIEKTTDSFRSLSITPELLETAAWLMRQGARRLRVSPAPTQSQEVKQKKQKPKGRPVSAKSPKKKTGGLDHQPGTMGKSN